MQDEEWRHMRAAPKDGTRILVTTRATEQGPSEVDVAYWAKADAFGIEGWRAADSHPGQVIAYADPELACWMPLPTPQPGGKRPAMPAPFQGDEGELFGSGI
jgi:hypothetical protein